MREKLTAEERAKIIHQSTLEVMAAFGSPRPIPSIEWFAEEIRSAERQAAEQMREAAASAVLREMTFSATAREIQTKMVSAIRSLPLPGDEEPALRCAKCDRTIATDEPMRELEVNVGEVLWVCLGCFDDYTPAQPDEVDERRRAQAAEGDGDES